MYCLLLIQKVIYALGVLWQSCTGTQCAFFRYYPVNSNSPCHVSLPSAKKKKQKWENQTVLSLRIQLSIKREIARLATEFIKGIGAIMVHGYTGNCCRFSVLHYESNSREDFKSIGAVTVCLCGIWRLIRVLGA